MECALRNSAVASSPIRNSTTLAVTQKRSGVVSLFNARRDSRNDENVITSFNEMALLESVTLKNILNINNINCKNYSSNNTQLLQQQNPHPNGSTPNDLCSSNVTLSSNESSSIVSSSPVAAPITDILPTASTGIAAAPITSTLSNTSVSDSTNDNDSSSISSSSSSNESSGSAKAKLPPGMLSITSLAAIEQNTTTAVLSASSSVKKSTTLGAFFLNGLGKNTRNTTSSTDVNNSVSIVGVDNNNVVTTEVTTTEALMTTTSNNNKKKFIKNSRNNFRIPSDILDDLASRFIINVPDMELSCAIRICFQIELAHWFYLDFFCTMKEEENKLRPCGIKQFAMQMFQHIPFLNKHLSTIDKILVDWKSYKLAVPTFGAILVSEDLNYCLLVQSYFAKSSWGFPKGKVNENEHPMHCATREVFEETGYDITKLIAPNDYIEAVINYQRTRLYIVHNVSLETKFSPRTRNEIKCCDWFPIDSLPSNKNDAISKAKLGMNANSFFMIMPFVKRLKKWINEKRAGKDPTVNNRRYSIGGGAAVTTLAAAAAAKAKSNFGRQQSPTMVSPTHTTALTFTNQKHLNANNSNKRNMHNNNINDDKNALINNNDENNINGVNSGYNCKNSVGFGGNTAYVNLYLKATSSNRSKRQRHKSMGDLDGIKLSNNNYYNNNQSNCKTLSTTTATTSLSTSTTTTANAVANNNVSNDNTNLNCNSNNRNTTIIVAAGSNDCNNTNDKNGIHSNNSNSNGNIVGSSFQTTKRQLYHSQSHNGTCNGEKIISSFDLIRKEKAAQKALQHKQQQQSCNVKNGRVRAKSQSDKQQPNKYTNGNNMQLQRVHQHTMIITNSKSNANKFNNNANNEMQLQRVQQQSMVITNSKSNASNNGSNKSCSNEMQMQRVQQQSVLITNSNFNAGKFNANNGNTKNCNNEMQLQRLQQSMIITNSNFNGNKFKNNSCVNGSKTSPNNIVPAICNATQYVAASTTSTTTTIIQQTPPASISMTGTELIAAIASAAAATTSSSTITQLTASQQQPIQLEQQYSVSEPNSARKPRSSSVSLQCTTPPAECSVQRIASGTNLSELLYDGTQQQPDQQHQQHYQHQNTQRHNREQRIQQRPHQLKFTPTLNSWTNFSFTKNFISNVFC